MRKIAITFFALTTLLSNSYAKDSWARTMRNMLMPFLSDENMTNWNRLIARVEGNPDTVSPFTPNELSSSLHNTNSTQEPSACTFNDIAGGVPQEITTLLDMIQNDEKYKRFGIAPAKGILLVGPPGCGKTLLARAIAGEAKCGFFYACASDFIEIYVGTGPMRIRELFNKATAYSKSYNKKSIIFIDELDAIGSRAALAGHDSESRRTLTELLSQMDGFGQNSNIIVLAASNNPQDIDPALKRAGRFDTIIEIPLPDKTRREAIIRHYISKIPTTTIHVSSISLDKLAEQSNGFNNADLKEMVRIACLRAAHENSSRIQQTHFETALEKIRKQKRF